MTEAPAAWGEYFPGMIVVAPTDENGQITNYARYEPTPIFP